jgi:pyruvate formate lyase activating enzyme
VSWDKITHPARLQEPLPDGVVRCHLSPRNCRIRPGQHGFCTVRANHDGRLVTLNYGYSVHATEEVIDAEAIFHYAPGEAALSLGNVGCMLNCDYCHNWKTSQARFANGDDIRRYTPDEVVDIAVRHGIRALSWTYNDPVVWHEFVRDTSALAHQAGLVNLFKSSFFISPEAIEELLPVIDIFAIELKSMDPKVYRKLTKGWIGPALDGARRVHQAGKHIEISMLMATDLSDDEQTARDVAAFVGEQLSPDVPLHLARFHPDYRMIDTVRTPIDRLHRARALAKDMGLHHVYIGNVYDGEVADTNCRRCGLTQVSRYGLAVRVVGLDEQARCTGCGADSGVILMPAEQAGSGRRATPEPPDDMRRAVFEWHGDVRSLHVQVRNDSTEPRPVYHRALAVDGAATPPWSALHLQPGESYRRGFTMTGRSDRGIEVAVPPDCTSSLHEVFDRAHFPTVEAGNGSLNGDVTPFPSYRETRAAAPP